MRTGETSHRSVGKVTLVGAGPGDADLLTLRGAKRLAEADLVLYDALSSDGMREYAPKARWFYVGKRANRPSISQDRLNQLLVRNAQRGLHVVRLKCGDPFVFGRGGEEALAVAEAGIPVEIVPGLSSCISGPGLMGIPVTHRGASSGFVVITGHDERRYRPILAGLPRQGLTLVVMMGLGERGTIGKSLLELGWDPQVPVALVVGAATPEAYRWTGRLAELEKQALPTAAEGAPGIVVVGEVVNLAAALADLAHADQGQAGASTGVALRG